MKNKNKTAATAPRESTINSTNPISETVSQNIVTTQDIRAIAETMKNEIKSKKMDGKRYPLS